MRAGATVAEALGAAEQRLRAAGIPEAALDAELLLRHVTSWDRATVLARSHDPLDVGLAASLFALVEERARRRPLQHLTSRQAFWKHEFLVTPDVLVPRPETELLVEHGLALVAAVSRPRILDVGTGSGCLALSLAAERPDATVTGLDTSARALAVARRNEAAILSGRRITWIRGDLLESVASCAVDLIVSNPPYVTAGEWVLLEPEVRDHDPRAALVPPEGPMALYSRLLQAAARALRPGGHAVVEVGHGQARDVAEIGRRAGLSHRSTLPDLQGIPRAIVFALTA